MRQVYLYLRGREYTHIEFRTPFFYRHARHPLYVGWLQTFWSASVVTVADLFFVSMTTAFILVAIRFEGADLATLYGDNR